MLLKTHKAPAIAPSPEPPTKRHLDVLFNALRLYFVQLDSVVGSVVGRLGGRYLQFPHGSFYSSTSQTVAVSTPALITFENPDYVNGVAYTTNSITAAYTGRYNVQFSLQFTNTDTQAHDASVWLRKNGVNVPWTTSTVTVPSTHGGIPGHYVVAANFFIELGVGDTISMVWATDNIGVTLEAIAATTSPYVSPGSPSAVITITFVGNLE